MAFFHLGFDMIIASYAILRHPTHYMKRQS